jgi:putative glutamine amidotransferase
MVPTIKPRIAIPVPHSGNREYSERVLPQYEHAIRQAGGEPVRIPLDGSAEELRSLIEGCDGILLPGSRADVEPRKYDAVRQPRTNEADSLRESADQELLRHAHEQRKPMLGICYGLQSLNVYCKGTLQQHIETSINHTDREKTHAVRVQPRSLLGRILREGGALTLQQELQVNSSHHQSADTVGEDLQACAEAPDGIIEALEGTVSDHFVLAVQWHPERSLEEAASQAIFRALIGAARARHDQRSAFKT